MITKLIVKNLTPLAKKGVTYVELDTKDIFNVVVGRNGFGKTSLLRELTPYPPDNADYGPGGYKESHHVVGKDTYILKSTTGKSSEHHFIHNGKNLNEGNTLLVQRELVKIHFGVTPFIKDVITGLDVRDLFTTLSSARRKDFLMAINPNDTTYALKVFDKLKSNLNALKGGLKTQRQRLVVEESRLSQLAGMEPDKLQVEIRVMDDQIKNALIIHGQLQSVQRSDLQPIKDEIANIISFLIGANHSVKHTRHTLYSMRERHENSLDYYKNNEIRLSAMLGEVTTQLAGLDGKNNLDGYKKALANSELSLTLNTEELEMIERRFKMHELFNGVYNDGNFYLQVEELISLLFSVEQCYDKEITSDKYRRAQTKLKELQTELETNKYHANEIRHTLNHFNKADSVDCPKCETKFKVGFADINIPQLNARLEVHDKRIAELQELVKRGEVYLETNQGWYESMGGLMRYTQRSEYGSLIVKLIGEYNVGKGDIMVLIDLLRSTAQCADITKTINVLKEEIENVSKQILFLESSDVETLFKRAAYIERELATSQAGVRRALNSISEVDNQLGTIILDEQKRDRLGIVLQELNDRLTENGKYRIKNRVEEIISELTPRKDSLISNLIRSESLNSVIQSIKDNIADMEKREKHTILLMDGLSPVKGLIGYLMNDFLKSVVANVNAIIQPIWTNRLHVLNCSTSKTDEDVDLNYSFPVMSGGSDKPNKDIGMCSGGEREIINFAFRLVTRRYLGERCGLPLMMDEVGVAFDELHRGRFCAYIAEQLRLDKMPQTFMISHSHKEIASAVNDANFIALNTEGLRLGFELNKKSKFK